MRNEDHSPWQSPGGEVTVPPAPDPEPADPEPEEEWDEEVEAPRRSSRKAWVITSVISVFALLCAGSVLFRNWYVATKSAEEAAKVDQWVEDNQSMASWPAARRVLTDHAAALLRGDEKGWLAAVDPKDDKLRAYYTNLFRTLRALGVTQWQYTTFMDPLENFGRTEIQVPATVVYCLTRTCPKGDPRDNLFQHIATIEQTIMMDKRNGGYRIVDVSQGHRPAPWQGGDLVLATGKRVVVGAPPSLRAELPDAVAKADRAAAAADRFAGYTGARPERYHLFLAGAKEWKTWYDGDQPDYAVGYATPVGLLSTDVVVDTTAVPGDGMVEVVQHEFGHVVTLGGADRAADMIFSVNQWLQEGIAEYIGKGPATAGGLGSLGAPPTAMVLAPLSDKSSSKQVSRLYGYGHLGVTCMASKYGEKRMFTFFNRLVRDKKDYDESAKAAFGQSFAQVDRTCAAYFKTMA